MSVKQSIRDANKIHPLCLMVPVRMPPLGKREICLNLRMRVAANRALPLTLKGIRKNGLPSSEPAPSVTRSMSWSIFMATFCIGGSQVRWQQPKAAWPVREHLWRSECKWWPQTFPAHARAGGQCASTTTMPCKVERDEHILISRLSLEVQKALLRTAYPKDVVSLTLTPRMLQ